MKFFKHSDILDPQHLDTPEKILRYFPVGSEVRYYGKIYTVEGIHIRKCDSPCGSYCASDGYALCLKTLEGLDGNLDGSCLYGKDSNGLMILPYDRERKE